jgi:hypothetical protein
VGTTRGEGGRKGKRVLERGDGSLSRWRARKAADRAGECEIRGGEHARERWGVSDVEREDLGASSHANQGPTRRRLGPGKDTNQRKLPRKAD